MCNRLQEARHHDRSRIRPEDVPVVVENCLKEIMQSGYLSTPTSQRKYLLRPRAWGSEPGVECRFERCWLFRHNPGETLA
jgi:hypothetical protein